MANNIVYRISAVDMLSGALKNINKNADTTDSKMANLGKTLKNVLSVAAIIKVGEAMFNFGKEIITTTNNLEALKNQLNFASGSAEQGAKDFNYIKDTANKLGLEFESAADAFAKFEGATRGTSLAGQRTKDIFEGVAAAGTVMHLSSEQMGGALTAIQQMVSKGKVSAEELNGQLGERLPGALGIAARSMGVTTAQLMDMMKQGKLISEEFLPRFANQLSEEFGPGLEKASKSGMAQMNRLSNNILFLKQSVGEATAGLQSSVVEGLTSIIQGFMDNMDKIKKVLKPLWNAVVDGFTKIKNTIIANQGFFEKFGNYLISLIPALVQVIKIVADVISKVIELWVWLEKTFSLFDTASSTINSIVSILTPLWELIKDIFGMAQGIIELDWSVFWRNATKGLSDLWDTVLALKDAFSDKKGKGYFTWEHVFGKGSEQIAEFFGFGSEKKEIKVKHGFGAGAGADFGEVVPKELTDKKLPTPPKITPSKPTKAVSGPKITTINITMDNLVGSFKVETNNMKEGANNAKDMVVAALTQALNDAQAIV